MKAHSGGGGGVAWNFPLSYWGRNRNVSGVCWEEGTVHFYESQSNFRSPPVLENDTSLMYQLIPNLAILPPGNPWGLARYDCPEGRVFAQLSLPGGRGFELGKFCTVLKEICGNFSIWFKETGGSLKSRGSCAVSCQFLQKQLPTSSLIT